VWASRRGRASRTSRIRACEAHGVALHLTRRHERCILCGRRGIAQAQHRQQMSRSYDRCSHICFFIYRADWEPAATSGKCMAGVPGALWRLLAVLQGPSTHNPAWIAGKPLILKNWPIFPIYMWKWAESAPSGPARVARPNWPQCAKSHAA
jgi:hypothetical protein